MPCWKSKDMLLHNYRLSFYELRVEDDYFVGLRKRVTWRLNLGCVELIVGQNEVASNNVVEVSTRSLRSTGLQATAKLQEINEA